ncbi:MAG: type II toxin-antitoxin system RelE/ParE family toxin [Propionibacteriaceae bacterium]|nr:type II toxin-antitoxin system RelE/ParE family toxin [Propionibacteriaceae bacterium]
MIRSFATGPTERIWNEEYVRSLDRRVQRIVLRKLELIHAAVELVDLRIPPGNRLEQLKGDRAGQHSIRVNDQWRICFVWCDGGADDVELVDYH